MLEGLLWRIAEKSRPAYVCVHVCPFVVSIFDCGARTAGTIWTGEAPFDATEWRTNDGPIAIV